jgi:SpoVK/Ycf46/Vps4 family AAA+-type ATPase
MESSTAFEVDGEQINRIQLTESRKEICLKIVKTAFYFFKKGRPTTSTPFRGFILEGPPSTGKTEIARQAAKILFDSLKGVYQVKLLFLDSADIATPRWGEAEEKLRKIFRASGNSRNNRFLILFDDIDCLMIKRGESISKEWHYSINSVLFHEIDKLNPANVLIIATTNRPDLIDEALRSRLYSIQVGPPAIEELMRIARQLLCDSGLQDIDVEKVLNIIEPKIKEMNPPTIRDLQHVLVMECIERGLWAA